MTTPRKPPTGFNGGFYTFGRAPNPELGELLLAPLIEEAKRERDKFNVDGMED